LKVKLFELRRTSAALTISPASWFWWPYSLVIRYLNEQLQPAPRRKRTFHMELA
jgi:hypothetical protein